MIGFYVCKYGLKHSTTVVMVTIRELHSKKTKALAMLLGSLNIFLAKENMFYVLGLFLFYFKAKFFET